VTGKITSTGSVKIGSNKSVIGAGPTAELVGLGLSVKGQKNVIIRNLKISKVVASSGDAVALQTSSNIWIDHLDLSSDMNNGKDFYDGLLDITHAVEWVTISNTKLHDHYKASLIGHSDSNAAEDTGKFHVTYVNNYWLNINSRGPSIRFGTGHIFNNVFEKVADGINVRKGGKVLVENNVWSGASKPLYSVDSTGGAISKGNDFGGATASLTTGGLTSVPYTYTAVDIAGAAAGIKAGAGNTLSFSA
jgi:pectate lyase